MEAHITASSTCFHSPTGSHCLCTSGYRCCWCGSYCYPHGPYRKGFDDNTFIGVLPDRVFTTMKLIDWPDEYESAKV